MDWINDHLIRDDTVAFVYEIVLFKDNIRYMYIGYKTLRNYKNYNSSSEYVKKDSLFIIEKRILRTFKTKERAIEYEEFLINELGAVDSPLFYNRQNAGKKFNTVGRPKSKLQIQTATDIIKKINSIPENIARATTVLSDINNSSEFKEKSRMQLEKIRSTDEYKELKRNLMTELNKRSDFICKRNENLRKLHNNEEIRKNNIDRLKEINSDPNICAIRDERIRLIATDPKYAEQRSKLLERLHNDENIKNNNIERLKALHNTPEFKEAHIKRLKSRSKSVRDIRTGKEYPSAKDASALTGESVLKIRDHCNNRYKNKDWEFV